MTREEELLEVIHKGNELIETQDNLINNYEKQLRMQEGIISRQEDIIKLMQTRIEELIGESEI